MYLKIKFRIIITIIRIIIVNLIKWRINTSRVAI